MMDGMMMHSGMMVGMGIFGLVVLLALGLGIAAASKYLFFDRH